LPCRCGRRGRLRLVASARRRARDHRARLDRAAGRGCRRATGAERDVVPDAVGRLSDDRRPAAAAERRRRPDVARRRLLAADGSSRLRDGAARLRAHGGWSPGATVHGRSRLAARRPLRGRLPGPFTRAVDFVDPEYGWVAPPDGRGCRTVDGVRSWQRLPFRSPFAFGGLSSLDPSTGFAACGGQPATIERAHRPSGVRLEPVLLIGATTPRSAGRGIAFICVAAPPDASSRSHLCPPERRSVLGLGRS
jgi:hypothetical protein